MDDSIRAGFEALERRRAKLDQRARRRAQRANARIAKKAPLLLHTGVIEAVTPERARAELERMDAGMERRLHEDAQRPDDSAAIAEIREAVLDHVRATGHRCVDDLVTELKRRAEGYPNDLFYRRWYWLEVLAGRELKPDFIRGPCAARFTDPEGCAELVEAFISEDAAEALGWRRPEPVRWQTMAYVSPSVLRSRMQREPELRAQVEADLQARQDAIDARHGVQFDLFDAGDEG